MKKNMTLIGILLFTTTLFAQDPSQPPPDQQPAIDGTPAQDPPSRVARLDLMQGQVSFQPAAVTDWTAATLNYPLTIGDHLYADDNSLAQLHIGTTAVRLGAHSGFSILNLDDRLAQIRVDTGALIIRVKFLEGDDAYEIDTAQGAITILRPGEYRIDTDPDRNATMVTVRTGDAEVSYSGGSFPVHPHQTAYFAGDNQQPQVQNENPVDSLDQFSMDMDRREDSVPAPRYVSREMPGWQDLERNGRWSTDPQYGPVWQPTTVAAGWAPYRYGHWAWIEPWGWTWIDDAPWGFAPFHYGRWVMVGPGWAWVPGPVAPRPVYAPALVAFVGGGAVGVGSVAWFPLGPREVFVPAYRVSPVYVNRVNVTTLNITNVTVVNRVYVNQTVGVTAVNQHTFVSAAPVGRATVVVPREAIARAQVTHVVAVAPERASVMGRAAAPATVPHPTAAVMTRSVYAQHAPPPAPVSFAARQQALKANPGRPLDIRTVNQLRTSAPPATPAVRTLPPRNTPASPTPQRPNFPTPTVTPSAKTPQPGPAPNPPVSIPRPPTPAVQPPATPQPVQRPTAERPAAQEHPAATREEKPAVKKENKKVKKEEKKEEK